MQTCQTRRDRVEVHPSCAICLSANANGGICRYNAEWSRFIHSVGDKPLRILAAGAALFLVIVIGSSLWLSRPLFDEKLLAAPSSSLAIAPIARAVTLAKTTDGAVLLVTSSDADGVSGVDLNAYFSRKFEHAVQAHGVLGTDRLVRVFGQASVMRRLSWDALVSPLPTFPRAIAAGTNYREHAEEVGHEGEPFLFPKLATPTSWDAPVADGARLDYEIELCAVPLAHYDGTVEVQLGFLLCNDFTDRWLLVRDIDLDGPMGKTGFALAKGGDSRMPVGPFLVIPRVEDFYSAIELSLYVNDDLRQRTDAKEMIWSPQQVLQKSLQQCAEQYESAGAAVSLGDCEPIKAGTVIMTGTPGGVMFNPLTIWAPWAYLGVDDVVRGYGTHLGMLTNVVTH